MLAVAPGVVGAGLAAPGKSPGGGNDNFGTQTPQLSANGRSYTGNLVMVDGMNVTSPIQNGNIILAADSGCGTGGYAAGQLLGRGK